MITQVAGPSNIYFIISSLKTRSKSIYILDRGEDNQIPMKIISHSAAEKTQNISNAVTISSSTLQYYLFENLLNLQVFDFLTPQSS